MTNARLVHLMLGPYRLKAHLRVLKKFLLHGQVTHTAVPLSNCFPELLL